MDKIFIVLYSIWAAIDSGRLSVGLSHPLVEAEAVLFSDPSNQPPGSSTLLKRNQSQINLSLCSSTQTCVSTDTSSSYSPNFIQKENNDNVGQDFSFLAKLPVTRQCCWVYKRPRQVGFLHIQKTCNRSSAG